MSIKWTDDQIKAITLHDRDLCVNAGAGCGKTGTLVERFIRLVMDSGHGVDEILAVTFTEKAASEMKLKIVRRFREIGEIEKSRQAEHATIATIHGFCAQLLREYPVEAEVDPEFVVMDEVASAVERDRVLDDVLDRQLSEDSPAYHFLISMGEHETRSSVFRVYDHSRSRGIAPSADPVVFNGKDGELSDLSDRVESLISRTYEEFKQSGSRDEALRLLQESKGGDPWSWRYVSCLNKALLKLRTLAAYSAVRDECEAIGRVINLFFESKAKELVSGLSELVQLFSQSYQERKRQLRCLDFEDLQLQTLSLLTSHPKIEADLRNRFCHVMVDEFQDINPLQNAIIRRICNERSLFVVGDAQQSIYRFRHADITIFREAAQSAATSDPCGLVPLAQNFRSRRRIIQFSNFIFQKLWDKQTGLFLELHSGATFPDNHPGNVELLLVEGESAKQAPERRTCEACSIARYIQEVVTPGKSASDSDSRPCYDYGDIVLLFRATTNIALYEQAFLDYGVPFYSISGTGFYEKQEIKDLLSFLKVIDNPLESIPLAAVLRSPMVEISDSALTFIARAVEEKGAPLFSGFRNRASIPQINPTDMEKLNRFSILLDELRQLHDRLSVLEVLERILSETRFEASLLAQPAGRRKLANVRKLLDIARNATGLHLTIHDFIYHMKDLEAKEIRESEARIESESGNVVRLMTIHAAKGLEFPLVIVPDMHYSNTIKYPGIILSQKGEISAKVPDPVSGEWVRPESYESIHQAEVVGERDEMTRLFYVAVTRARERLVLSGLNRGVKADSMSFAGLLADIIPQEKWRRGRIEIDHELVLHVIGAEPDDEALPVFGAGTTLADHPEMELPEPDSVLCQEILSRINQPVPIKPKPHRFTVTQLLTYSNCPKRYDLRYNWRVPEWIDGSEDHEDMDFDEAIPVPDHPLSELQMGLVAHKALEVYRFNNQPENAISDALRQLGLSADSDQIRRLIRFLQSAEQNYLGKLLTDCLWQEREFRYTIRVGNEIVSGAIDLLYKDAKERIGIVDYKTNRIGSSEVAEIAAEYRFQVHSYAWAAYQLTGHVPNSVCLYFIAPGLPHETIVTPEIIDQAYEQLTANILGIQEEQYIAQTGKHCYHCKFAGRLCPEGMGYMRNDLKYSNTAEQ